MASSNEQAQATGELLHARDPSMSRRACMKLLSLVTSVTVHTLRPPDPACHGVVACLLARRLTLLPPPTVPRRARVSPLPLPPMAFENVVEERES
jgi:hypothetical protein